MAANLNPSIRRAQLFNEVSWQTTGKVTHLFIFTPFTLSEVWQSLCGRLVYIRPGSIRDNHHLRLCKDCQSRLNLLNDLVKD